MLMYWIQCGEYIVSCVSREYNLPIYAYSTLFGNKTNMIRGWKMFSWDEIFSIVLYLLSKNKEQLKIQLWQKYEWIISNKK